MEKKKDVDWVKLNYWRWEFLRISRAYKEFYQEHQTKPVKSINLKCLSWFNLILTEKFIAADKLPDPQKRIKDQPGPIRFYDYYYPLEGKSLVMGQHFGKEFNKLPCLNITKMQDDKIISAKKLQEINGFIIKYSDRHEESIDSHRVIPGIALFAIDLNVPTALLMEKFEHQIKELRESFRKKSTEKANFFRYYRHDKQGENQRFEDFKKYWFAYRAYQSTNGDIAKAREWFKKHAGSVLTKEKISDRNFSSWKKKGEDLVIAASKGFFPYPD